MAVTRSSQGHGICVVFKSWVLKRTRRSQFNFNHMESREGQDLVALLR